jgi:hypothetical protein
MFMPVVKLLLAMVIPTMLFPWKYVFASFMDHD